MCTEGSSGSFKTSREHTTPTEHLQTETERWPASTCLSLFRAKSRTLPPPPSQTTRSKHRLELLHLQHIENAILVQSLLQSNPCTRKKPSTFANPALTFLPLSFWSAFKPPIPSAPLSIWKMKKWNKNSS